MKTESMGNVSISMERYELWKLQSELLEQINIEYQDACEGADTVEVKKQQLENWNIFLGHRGDALERITTKNKELGAI